MSFLLTKTVLEINVVCPPPSLCGPRPIRTGLAPALPAKSLESRLQAAGRANFCGAGDIPGRPTMSTLWPAKAGTPNEVLEGL